MPQKSASKRKNRKKNMKANKGTEDLVSPPARERKDDGKICDAILLTRSEGGGDEDIKENAGCALRQALGEPLHIETIRDELFVGNDRGLDLAGKSAQARTLESEVALLKDSVFSLERSHKAEIAELKEILHTLRFSWKEHRLVRNRFISTYKRDKLGTSDGLDGQIIRDGNKVAHWGDAIMDSTFYTSPAERTDRDVFRKLYGLSPLEVRLLGVKHKPTITVLNIHAGIISSSFKKGSDKFYESFAEFVRLLKGSNYDESYLEDRKPNKKLDNLVSAYHSFLRCAEEEVDEVEK